MENGHDGRDSTMTRYAATEHIDAAALARVRIVLMQTSQPRNIGSTARAMKTMGLADLRLVAPKKFPHAEATALASGATDVLERAYVVEALGDAIAETTLSFAVTARRRELAHPACDAREAAAAAVDELAAGGTVAFVFGTEMSGLANEDVLKCSRILHIPANPQYASLNLAMAVQIVAYELWMAQARPRVAPSARPALATHDELEQLYAHLEETVLASGFLDPYQPKRLMDRVRRLFGRASLEHEEVNILRGMLRSFRR